MDGMIILLCFLSWPAQAAAKWYIDKHLFECCNQVEFRLRELGVEYEIPAKIEPYFDYPALLIRLSEKHLDCDREGWLLASKLKVIHSLMAAAAIGTFLIMAAGVVVYQVVYGP